ncbi:MAG TPA: hypothetical protein VEF33_01685 [Syntrophales bacterium]|nr:hypothetical protein [Syntrophales bacterium]
MIQIMNRNNWLLAFTMMIFIAAFITQAWAALRQMAYQKLNMMEKTPITARFSVTKISTYAVLVAVFLITIPSTR